jgi:hypothetical protein
MFSFEWSQISNLIKFLWFKIFLTGPERNLTWGFHIEPCNHRECCVFQTDEQEVITFLLTTEIIPLCLRIMESGSELSKTVATFILQKILLDDSGLSYICQTYDRFSHVAMILVSNAQWEIVVTCVLNSYPGHASTQSLFHFRAMTLVCTMSIPSILLSNIY